EMWSDLRAFDGTATVVQPLIAPLYQGRSCHQIINMLMGRLDDSDYELVRETWRSLPAARADFESYWRNALNVGLLNGTTFQTRQVTVNAGAISNAPTTAPAKLAAGALEAIFRPDPTVGDGYWSNNGWLQECPKPLTKLTWDNAALMSEATANALGLDNDDCVELSVGEGGNTVKGSVLVLPGHPDESVTLHLGYGRSRAGRIGNGMGFNAYAIRRRDPWQVADLNVRSAGDSSELAITQQHQMMDSRRDLLPVIPITKYTQESEPTEEHRTLPLTLYPSPVDYNDTGPWGENHKWGMSIDNNACIGCNACVLACNAENNVPVVGKDQVIKGREMHWLRIDAYFAGSRETPAGPYFEPVPCQQCENAPCELVCPVEATSHSAEGLNEMTYNRCVGTRYCSNNCPYKVRHFNFLLYQDMTTESFKLARNPYVTVRARGVMEKCTYCVQRINAGRIAFKKLVATAATPLATMQDATVSNDDKNDAIKFYGSLTDQAKRAIEGIQTACQQSCPTNAIVFGDLNRKKMAVVALKNEPGDYSLLEELNTRPRTTYLPRLTNRNSSLPAPAEEGA
ncbi:MAG: 4Fe-4S dicluster domain-containing protein, partial [Phycisphaerae bacterium]|nr:4Fe-4S dicluster domain-containing protein [Phycisphaerae bacterium]